MAVWEKQQSSDSCSILQNYRLTGKTPSSALNLHTIVCTPHLSLWWISSGASCEYNNVAKKTHDITSTGTVGFAHELLLNWNCLACSALPLLPISALHATQTEMGLKKEMKSSVFMWISFWNTTTSSCVSWNGINNYIEPAPFLQLSMVKPEAHTKHFPHIHSLYSTMTSSCPVNCILYYSEWLYTIKSLRRAKMSSKIWKWQTKAIYNSCNRCGIIQGKIYHWDCAQSQVSGCSIPIPFCAPSNGKPSSSIMVSWLQGLRSHVQTLMGQWSSAATRTSQLQVWKAP